MTTLTTSRLLAAVLAVGGGLVAFAPAQAQLGIPTANPLGGGLRTPQAAPEAPSPAPAPALPGSRPAPDAPAPAERLPLDMAPTEALFDAINRGDITAARDALGRGAD